MSTTASMDSPTGEPATLPRFDALLWLPLVLVGLLLCGLSIARYEGYNAGMIDLGNMTQAIWSATQGQPLVFTQWFGPFSRLSGHFELFYFLLAPLYALWPDARSLVVAQAVLFVAGAWPAYHLAGRVTGSLFAARAIALIYLVYPVAQTAVLFDLHADTLAMPWLMFALNALDKRAWGRFALFAVLAMSCKVYVGIMVAGIGGYLFLWGGQRRAGVVIASLAMLYVVVVFLGVRPLFQVTELPTGNATVAYFSHYYGALGEIWQTLPHRLLNAVVVLGPVLLVARHGWRWLVLILPVLLAVLVSTGPGMVYDYRSHHYALLVPFIIRALIDGVRHQQEQASRAGIPPHRQRKWRNDLGLTLAIVLLCFALLVDTPFNPLFWVAPTGQGLDVAEYGITPRDALKDQFLADHVPPDVPLAASMLLAPHLTNRETLHVVRYAHDPGGELLPLVLPNVDYVLADALFDWRQILGDGFAGGASYETAEIGLLLNDPDFALITMHDGLLLFARTPPPEPVLRQQVEVLPVPDDFSFPNPDAQAPVLLDARVTPLDTAERRYRMETEWQVSPAFQGQPAVAVGRLDGPATQPTMQPFRIVHLPGYILYPTTEWQPDQRIRETFDVVLPADLPPGSYDWHISWYNLLHSEAFATDARSRLPDSTSTISGAFVVTDETPVAD